MRNKDTTRLRAECVPQARGNVLEIGIGSGLNLPFYSSDVQRVHGVDPSLELQRIARKHHCSPYAVVLAWVRAKGSTIVPIPGATTPEHTVDSAKSVSVKLSPKEIAAIDATEFPRT